MAFYDKIFRPAALSSASSGAGNPAGPRIVSRDPHAPSDYPRARAWSGLRRPFDRLSGPAAEIIAELIQQEEEARETARTIRDKIEATREKCELAKAYRNELITGTYSERDFPIRLTEPVAKDSPTVVVQDDIISGCNDFIAKQQSRHDPLMEVANNCANLLRNVENWLADIDRGFPIKAHSGSTPQLQKSEAIVDAIERCRRRVRELRADHDRYRAAPFHSSVVKKAERERIEALATLGAPDAFQAIERNAPLQWPTEAVRATAVVGEPMFAHMEIPNVMPILAFLLRDQMIKAAEAAIDAIADDDAALSDVERAKLIAQAQRDALAVQREEVFFVAASNSQGHPILHRADIDPRALLGLAADLPAPRPQ